MTDIKAGDLAYIAHPMKCCGARPGQGMFVKVKFLAIADPSTTWFCNTCGKIGDAEEILAEFDTANGPLCVEVYRLKKIDPLEEDLPENIEKELVI